MSDNSCSFDIIAVCSEIHTKQIQVLCGQNVQFLGVFAKLRKPTFILVLSVCLSAQLRSHGTDFHEI